MINIAGVEMGAHLCYLLSTMFSYSHTMPYKRTLSIFDLYIRFDYFAYMLVSFIDIYQEVSDKEVSLNWLYFTGISLWEEDQDIGDGATGI